MTMSTSKRRRTLLQGLGLTLVAPQLLAASALKVPKELQGKTIKLIVGFPPGGGTDITARTLAFYLTELTGLAVVVENKVGAGGMIATEYVSRGRADPTEWLCVTTGQLITNPLLMSLNYDPMQRLYLAARSSAGPLVLVVKEDSALTRFSDLLDLSASSSQPLAYGSAGIGTPQHIGVEWLQSLAGFEAIHAPYRGSNPSMVALMSGEIDFVLESGTAAASHVRGGKIKAIAQSGGVMSDEYLKVPVLTDLYPEFQMVTWSGVALSADVSPEVKQFAQSSLQAALTHPAFIKKLKEQGGNPNWLGPDEFLKEVQTEYEITKRLIAERNITL